MNALSPYTPPSMSERNESQCSDPKLLIAIAVRLAEAKVNPPTVRGLLCKWPGTPSVVLVGVIGTATLAYVVGSVDLPLASHVPVGFAMMSFGALLRDIGVARRTAKLWRPQSHFIDWRKVDVFMSYEPTSRP